MNQASQNHLKQVGLGFDAVCDTVHNEIYQHLGPSLQETVDQLLTESSNFGTHHEFFAHVLQEIDFQLGIRDEEGRWCDSPLLAQPRDLIAGLDQCGSQLGNVMVQWILSLVDESQYHLRGAQQATRWYDQHLAALRDDAQQAEQKINGEIVHLYEELTGPPPTDKNARRAAAENPSPQQRMEQYQRLRLFRLTLHGVRRVVTALRTRLEETSECLQDLRRVFTEMTQEFEFSNAAVHQTSSAESELDEVEELSEALSDRVHGQISELATKLDEEFRNDFLDEFGGLRGTLGQDVNLYNNISSALRRTARELIMAAQENDDIISMVLPPDEDPEKSVRRLVRFVETATPELIDCGGTKRLLMVVPKASKYDRMKMVIERGLNESVSVAYNNIGDAVLCYELDQIPLAQIAGKFIDNRRDYAEIAPRLHARNDITWSPW